MSHIYFQEENFNDYHTNTFSFVDSAIRRLETSYIKSSVLLQLLQQQQLLLI